jgi:hypothetical protein
MKYLIFFMQLKEIKLPGFSYTDTKAELPTAAVVFTLIPSSHV